MPFRTAEHKPGAGPLDGITVLDASTILAGPLTCQILGDFGADVIKIEHPVGGDGLRGHGYARDGVPLWWKMVGRNKRTMGLDLGAPDGASVFLDLVEHADIVVENFRPGTLKRWGVGYEEIQARNPRAVLLSVTGFGQHGPYSSRRGFGTLAEAMSGFAYLTGEADGPPTLPPFGLADSIAGITGAVAALMAIYHRDARGGNGQHIDLDILLPIMTAVGPAVMYADQLGLDLARHGNRSVNNAPRNTYRTLDGRWVAVSTSADSVAQRVMALVGRSEFIREGWFSTGRGRAEHADELDSCVAEWIAARNRDEVLEQFEEAGAAIAPIYSPAEILTDQHFRESGMITPVPDMELGPLLMQNILFRMGSTPGAIRHTGRKRGADTDEILHSTLGYSEARISQLRAAGVVA